MDNVEDYYMAEENLWGAERGAFVSPVSLSLQISLAFLPGLVHGLGVGVVFVGFWFFVVFLFRGNLSSISTNSSCWPTMSRTSPAMQEKNGCLWRLSSNIALSSTEAMMFFGGATTYEATKGSLDDVLMSILLQFRASDTHEAKWREGC